MIKSERSRLRILSTALTLVALAVLFYFKAQQNLLHQDPLNSNFFSFWLSGRMVWTGESPYDSTQWLRAFDEFGASYRPSQILQYPLPLMFLMAPLGLLPIRTAYFVWLIVSQCIVAFSVYVLLRQASAPRLLLLPVVVSLLFFGPLYLTLQLGAVGPLSLLALTVALVLFDHHKPVLAGIALSLTLLKPPQALPLLLLVGFWLLSARQWKAIAGLCLGALGLLLVWVLQDPLWLAKFRASSSFLLGHSLGVQSNVFGFAYLACHQSAPCMWILGSVSALVLVLLGAYFLWRNRLTLSAWQAFDLIIPLSFCLSLYLWSYDQVLYVIPIVWIAARLLEKTHSYLPTFLFLLILDVVSLVALAVEANTHNDLLSIVTTLAVLALTLWLLPTPGRASASFDSPIDKARSHA